MRTFQFFKFCPGGNTTVLVTHPFISSPLKRVAIARRLMNPLHLGCEQVGYVDVSGQIPRLDMMGGEFCGNAARCFVVYLTRIQHPALVQVEKNCYQGSIAISGTQKTLKVQTFLSGDVISAKTLGVPDATANVSFHVRKTVAHKLARANSALRLINPTLRLKIRHGYRPPFLQQHYFEQRKEFLLKSGQTFATELQLLECIHLAVAVPEVAGHPTGGAVDVSIYDIQFEPEGNH